MDFVSWIEDELEKREWSRSDLARKSGVTPTQVTRVLSRKQGPGQDFIEGIARAFNLPLDVVYQKANLLPTKNKRDELEEEASYLFAKLKDKRTAIKLLRALGEDDEETKTIPDSGRSQTAPR